ncbi:putative thymidylate kinase protein [Neofusicoccum parvum UCRNP2]|uniref:Putative thymidylate kinase protein n=1 Tax=Botryosphaeria parva (strain UCR-NP2) TaxID=1287680 RepID=R1H3L6_BOTPV|nr:putative thymidylate kinase protein [Neofusicoccum parvum UCRNP2]
MTAHVPARQPFAALDSPRLHNLASAKNRQNSIPASPFSFSSPSGKQLNLSPSKRRHTTQAFDDDFDSENVDPALFSSPTKRSKNLDGTPKKVSKFILKTDAVPTSSSSARSSAPAPTSQKPRTSSVSSKPSISTSRGSPKHKRVGLLSKRRTTRIDPPAFGLSPRRDSGLPFSIDAALTGTISSYAPSPKAVKPKPAPTLDEAMPNGWFFEIHEDSPEEEATNMMEHSAYILDISSDDDSDTRAENESREKGKENIPPPDYHLASTSRSASTSEADATEPSKLLKHRRKLDSDAMEEDRSPLSDLPASDYFADGLDANSHVIIDGNAPEKSSSLSKECTFEDIPTQEKEAATVPPIMQPTENVEKETESAEPEFPSSEESKDFVVFDETAAAADVVPETTEAAKA